MYIILLDIADIIFYSSPSGTKGRLQKKNVHFILLWWIRGGGARRWIRKGVNVITLTLPTVDKDTGAGGCPAVDKKKPLM